MSTARTLLRMQEVHVRTGIPIDTLRFWRHRGDGPPSFRLGARVVYDEAELNAWIDAQRQREGVRATG